MTCVHFSRSNLAAHERELYTDITLVCHTKVLVLVLVPMPGFERCKVLADTTTQLKVVLCIYVTILLNVCVCIIECVMASALEFTCTVLVL